MMYKLLNLPILIIVLISISLLISCRKEINNKDNFQNENYIDNKSAIVIAEYFMKNKFNSLKKDQNKQYSGSMLPTKEIETTVAIKAKDGLNVFYIVNYTGGGFAIISADKRTPKILAFSNVNSFKTDNHPQGIAEWLNITKLKIEELRDLKIPYDGQDRINIFQTDIKSNTINVRGVPDPVDTTCTGSYESVDLSMQTKWYQNDGYNNQMPAKSCSPNLNGKAYTGCVTTAMAQVIRYHGYPTTFNYSIMPNNVGSNYTSTGTNEIAGLMRACFDAVDNYGNQSPDIDCNVTNLNTEDIPAALMGGFGYSNTVHYINYAGTSNYNVVKDELRAGRPVIFRGGRDGGIFSVPRYRDGHAWVSDGFYSATVCGENGGYTGSYGVLYFQMNWGWGGTYDGLYGLSDFHMGTSTYNYKAGVIVGIKP